MLRGTTMTTTTIRMLMAITAFGLTTTTGCAVEHGGGEDLPIGPTIVLDAGPGGDDGDPGEGNGPKTPGREFPDPEPEGNPEPEVEPDVVAEPDPEPQMMASTRHNLVWKRYRAVERDLMRALSLTKAEVCNELGQFNCVDLAHLAPLGGNEPFDLGQYEPVAAPTASTAIALDRVVLSACAERIRKDRQGNPQVFTDLDLTKMEMSVNLDGPAIDATTTMLYRRLLSRDPIAVELDAVRQLVADEGPMTAESFAKMTCYAIGTTVENFFY